MYSDTIIDPVRQLSQTISAKTLYSYNIKSVGVTRDERKVRGEKKNEKKRREMERCRDTGAHLTDERKMTWT